MFRYLQPNPDLRRQSERLAKALTKLDKQLSDAQQLIGSELSSTDVKTEFPQVYNLADSLWSELEKLRRKLRR